MKDVLFISLVVISACLVLAFAQSSSVSVSSASAWFLKSVLGYQCHAMQCSGAAL